MKKKLLFPAFVLAAAAGYFIGYGSAKKKYEKTEQQIIDEYRKAYSVKAEKVANYVQVHSETSINRSDNSGNTIDDMGRPSGSIIDPTESLKSEYEKFIEEEYFADDEVPGPSEHSTDPYPIPYEKYSEENYHYDKKSIIYYEGNDVIIYDESEEPIYDDVMLFGPEWREELDIYNNDIGYIRNDNLSTDFEIIVKRTSYEGEDLVEY